MKSNLTGKWEQLLLVFLAFLLHSRRLGRMDSPLSVQCEILFIFKQTVKKDNEVKI